MRKLFLVKKYAYICLNNAINDKKLIKKQKPLIQVSARISEELLSVHRKISKTKKISLSQHIHNLLDNFSDEHLKIEEIFNENLLEKDKIISDLKVENSNLTRELSNVNKEFSDFTSIMMRTAGLCYYNEDNRQIQKDFLLQKYNNPQGIAMSIGMSKPHQKHIIVKK